MYLLLFFLCVVCLLCNKTTEIMQLNNKLYHIQLPDFEILPCTFAYIV